MTDPVPAVSDTESRPPGQGGDVLVTCCLRLSDVLYSLGILVPPDAIVSAVQQDTDTLVVVIRKGNTEGYSA